MIRNNTRNQLLTFLLALGFFIGIIFENIVCSIQIFQIERLRMFSTMHISTREYLFHISLIRAIPLVILVILWNFRWRKVIIALATVFLGFMFGRFLVSAILLHGIKGIVLCMAVLFPHMFFYAFVYLIFALHLFQNRRRWNKVKTAVLVVCCLLGICSEVYINPQILKIVIGWL